MHLMPFSTNDVQTRRSQLPALTPYSCRVLSRLRQLQRLAD